MSPQRVTWLVLGCAAAMVGVFVASRSGSKVAAYTVRWTQAPLEPWRRPWSRTTPPLPAGGPPLDPHAGRATGPPDGALVRRIGAALQRRAEQAGPLSATLVGVHWQSTVQPQTGDQLPRLAWGPDAVWSASVTQRAGMSRLDTWSVFDGREPCGEIDVVCSSVQSEDRRDCLWFVMDRPEGARPRQQEYLHKTTAPQPGHAWYLTALGLAGMAGAGWAYRLRAPYHLDRNRSLRGHPCVVVSREDSDLWVARDLGFAPIRLVQVAPGGETTVLDWWDFRPCGPLRLPRMSSDRVLRGVASGRCAAALSVSRAAALEVGAVEPLLRPMPSGSGQVAAGSQLGRIDGGRLEAQARELLAIAEQDCAAWGVSADALSRDARLKLPDEPRPAPARQSTVP
ncbi:MAG: hypothetical protein HYU66_06390 [Armatimonadetes bacterium]|nr:hypothetical protein [Armatimonadota bacterium]